MKIFVLLFILGASIVYSQTNYMNVHNKGGGTTSIPIKEITKLTFRCDGCGAVGNERISTVIKTFTLLQNYPNPFNPTTTIEYQLPKAGSVDIKIYDMNGRLIRSVLSRRQEMGIHSLRWDSRNDAGTPVASGMYFYQVRFDNSVLSRKMLLLK
jgi:hypothetical protein